MARISGWEHPRSIIPKTSTGPDSEESEDVTFGISRQGSTPPQKLRKGTIKTLQTTMRGHLSCNQLIPSHNPKSLGANARN